MGERTDVHTQKCRNQQNRQKKMRPTRVPNVSFVVDSSLQILTMDVKYMKDIHYIKTGRTESMAERGECDQD